MFLPLPRELASKYSFKKTESTYNLQHHLLWTRGPSDVCTELLWISYVAQHPFISHGKQPSALSRE